ncbi:MAG TPA: cobamide remodeling phosphodiesterase CbiR [Chitinispirillaceae bacterium]|nr:cobamide remodeling phosphodiesterase CbiR [Chitinispirillaceae bacterium]
MRFPFLSGTTSYIIENDLIHNALFLSEYVDDIELVLFENEGFSNIPSPSDIGRLKGVQEQRSIGYTVHFPIDKKAGSQSLHERIGFIDSAKKIIELTLPLSPRAWLLHLEGVYPDASTREIDQWKSWTQYTIEQLCDLCGDSSKIAIENLGYPWYWHLESAAQAGTSLCCDIGHLWLYFPECWKEYCKAMLPHTSVIHLHGVNGDRDHTSLKYLDPAKLESFLRIVKKYDYKGVITLEIFSEAEFFESIAILDEVWKRVGPT